MVDWAPYAGVLANIRAEWDKAEQDIKIAEQVCEDIVFPSILELRYGGRRIIEAILKVENNAPKQEIETLLKDALFDCYRARHDAIDAATSKIAIDLEIAVKKLKLNVILSVFPNFGQLTRKLSELRALIVKSRGNRQDREAIYQTISSQIFPELVVLYEDFQNCDNLMQRYAAQERWKMVLCYIFGGTGVIGLIITIIQLFK